MAERFSNDAVPRRGVTHPLSGITDPQPGITRLLLGMDQPPSESAIPSSEWISHFHGISHSFLGSIIRSREGDLHSLDWITHSRESVIHSWEWIVHSRESVIDSRSAKGKTAKKRPKFQLSAYALSKFAWSLVWWFRGSSPRISGAQNQFIVNAQ